MANTPLSERTFDKPVAWLAGRDLLGGIKGMLLYTAYGSKLDPRDWMTGKVHEFQPTRGKQEFWFDYLADAGDGTKAMYAIAYLSMTHLWKSAAPGGGAEIAFEDGDGRLALPRGEFLFIGGDTSYHVADLLTLANRIQRPFTYAYEDLSKHVEIKQCPVFGIPGNHDYYDQVDGFRRQFRKPTRPEPPQPPESPGRKDAQLGVAGYYRAQEASYVALKLPFDWWLWGLDTETGPLDRRQERFFRTFGANDEDYDSIKNATGGEFPKKLIIATPSPSTFFGKVASEEKDFKATQAMQRLLGRKQPFLPKKKKDGTFDFSKTGDASLEKGECRLDLSGDVHHYARYWGPQPDKVVRARACAKAATPSAESYASVVSGLGGAFHHPCNTYDDEIQEQVLYPDEKASREAVGNQIFNFWSISQGGYVWLFGLIIAFVIYFALSVTQSSRQFLSNFGPLQHLGLVEEGSIPIMPTTAQPQSVEPCQPVEPFELWKWLGISGSWPPTSCSPTQPSYFFGTSMGGWPKDLIVGQALIFLSLIATIVTFFLRNWLFGQKGKIDEEDQTRAEAAPPNPSRKLAWIVPPIAAAVILGMMTVERYHNYITPYVSSLMVLFTIIIAAAAIVLTVRYNDYLFQKGHNDYITNWDRIWPWVLPILSVLVLSAGLWTFGRNNLPALLVTDILSTVVFVSVLIALIFLPITSISGELLYTLRRPKLANAGKALIGLWHAALQLFLPFVLIRRGTWLTWLLAAGLVVFPVWHAAKLFKNNRRVWLLSLWLVYGGLMLVLPWLTSRPSSSYFFGASWYGPWGLVPSFFAGLVGAIMSCLWFGWYLGICSIFNGHNNEVGGAARIEQFKQFIRFRLTEQGLTGYVIAVNEVSMIGEVKGGRTQDGRDLKPKLIDVFHLKVK